MSELLNKYKDLHNQFISLLVEYNNRHTDYLRSQTVKSTGALRKVTKQIRVIQKELWKVSQERLEELKNEKRISWGRPTREKKNE